MVLDRGQQDGADVRFGPEAVIWQTNLGVIVRAGKRSLTCSHARKSVTYGVTAGSVHLLIV